MSRDIQYPMQLVTLISVPLMVARKFEYNSKLQPLV